jgi:hypothetical protein
MVPAFTRVAKLLSPHGPEPVVESIPSFPSGWKFPTGLGSSDPPPTADPATTAFVNELLDPTYFDTQPFSSGSSDMPTSTHSSTGTAHSQLNDSAPDMSNQMYGLLASDLMQDEPPEYNGWAGMDFQPSGSAIPMPPANRFLGHHATTSTSESERTHSTEESSVDTPVLDALGLSNINDGMEGEAPPAQSHVEGAMDFRW